MSSLRVDNISSRTGSTIYIPSGTSLYAPGHIIQVVNTYYKTATALSIPASVTTYTDVPGVSATITPKSINSKIYITVRWFGEWNPTSINWQSMFNIKKNGVPVGQPDPNGTNTLGIHAGAMSYYSTDADSTPETVFFDYYEAASSISPITYSLAVASYTAGTMYINRCVNASSGNDYERGTSSITLFEIAG